MKHLILPLALVIAVIATPCFAGGLFAGDDNMHVQGHPYEASSYHKAFHGADSFETLPMHFAGYGRRGHYGHGYGRGYGYGHGGYASYGHYGHGYGGHAGCGCGCKKHFGWFKGHGCGCGHKFGHRHSACGCGCETTSCCQPCCKKKWYKSWFKGFGCGCGCGHSACDSCGETYEGSAEEIMPEPSQNDDAAPVPTEASAQFRSLLPSAEVVSPTAVLFPFFSVR